MSKETVYGVISDIHHDPRVAYAATNVLKNLGAQKLIVNGDIGEWQENPENTQRFSAIILDAVGESGLESYVQPGSHEQLGLFHPVLNAYRSEYSNLVDATLVSKIEEDGHHLVFLPGSDFLCGGNYKLANEPDCKTAIYRTGQGHVHYKSMDDLRSEVTEPEKTIVVCHVPRLFDNPEVSVDMAYFAEQADGSVIPGIAFEQMVKSKIGDVSQSELEKIAGDNGLTLQRKNRGNSDLKELYVELGIEKAVSGHFHESGHRANDAAGNPVSEGEYSDSLFWNSGHLDVGQTGLLFVKDGKVKYHNVRLQDYR